MYRRYLLSTWKQWSITKYTVSKIPKWISLFVLPMVDTTWSHDTCSVPKWCCSSRDTFDILKFSMIASPRGHKQSWSLIYREWSNSVRMSSILDTGSQNCTHTLKNSSRAWLVQSVEEKLRWKSWGGWYFRPRKEGLYYRNSSQKRVHVAWRNVSYILQKQLALISNIRFIH